MSDAQTSALRELVRVLVEGRILSAVQVNTMIHRLNDVHDEEDAEYEDELEAVINALNDAISGAAEFDPNLDLPRREA